MVFKLILLGYMEIRSGSFRVRHSWAFLLSFGLNPDFRYFRAVFSLIPDLSAALLSGIFCNDIFNLLYWVSVITQLHLHSALLCYFLPDTFNCRYQGVYIVV